MSYTFAGDEYVEKRDKAALSSQLERVREILSDQKWRSVSKIQQRIKQRFGVLDPENSIQAQCRHLRNVANGGYVVPKKLIQRTGARGYWVYRLGEVDPNAGRPTLEAKSRPELIKIIRRLRKKLRSQLCRRCAEEI